MLHFRFRTQWVETSKKISHETRIAPQMHLMHRAGLNQSILLPRITKWNEDNVVVPKLIPPPSTPLNIKYVVSPAITINVKVGKPFRLDRESILVIPYTNLQNSAKEVTVCDVLYHSKGLFTWRWGPQVGEVTGGGLLQLTCKRAQIKMTDYMDMWVTPPKRFTSPTWGLPPSCKQALRYCKPRSYDRITKDLQLPTWPCELVG